MIFWKYLVRHQSTKQMEILSWWWRQMKTPRINKVFFKSMNNLQPKECYIHLCKVVQILTLRYSILNHRCCNASSTRGKVRRSAKSADCSSSGDKIVCTMFHSNLMCNYKDILVRIQETEKPMLASLKAMLLMWLQSWFCHSWYQRPVKSRWSIQNLLLTKMCQASSFQTGFGKGNHLQISVSTLNNWHMHDIHSAFYIHTCTRK